MLLEFYTSTFSLKMLMFLPFISLCFSSLPQSRGLYFLVRKHSPSKQSMFPVMNNVFDFESRVTEVSRG